MIAIRRLALAALLAVVAGALLVGGAAALAPRWPGCGAAYWCRWLGWRASDVGDLQRFPAARVAAPVAELTGRELWEPLGAERDASWSLDSERGGMAKMESGFNAAPVDFVKLGRLLLDEGRPRSGAPLLSPDYLRAVWTPDPALRVGDGLHYQLGWWLHTDAPTNATPDTGAPWALAGWGHLGQLLYAFPAEDVVIVRFGREMGELRDFQAWGAVLRQVAAAAAD